MKSCSMLLNSNAKYNTLKGKRCHGFENSLLSYFPFYTPVIYFKIFLKEQNYISDISICCFSSTKHLLIISFEIFIFLRQNRDRE